MVRRRGKHTPASAQKLSINKSEIKKKSLLLFWYDVVKVKKLKQLLVLLPGKETTSIKTLFFLFCF